MGVAENQKTPSVDYVLDQTDPRRQRLESLIRKHSLKFGDFILSSGRASAYLFQLRQTTMLPEGAALLGEIICEYMERCAIKSVGGPELGAVPIVAAVAAMSHVRGAPVNAFFVRKAAKAHGARERLDGHLGQGEALVVDDVATSGGSLLMAVEGLAAEAPALQVRRAFVIIDREEGAAEALAKRGIQLAAIFKTSDFLERP